MSDDVAQMLADLTARLEAQRQYGKAAERHCDRAMTEKELGHSSRARFRARLALRLLKEMEYRQ